jgi:hypothetical protein
VSCVDEPVTFAGTSEGAEMTAQKKEHKIQVLMNGYRYVAHDVKSTITISRDGDRIGTAKWYEDQLVNSSASLPDEVFYALEKKLKERMDANWDEE